jgi:hypothetical protein
VARNLPTYQRRLSQSAGSPSISRAAKALGLEVPPSLRALADEVQAVSRCLDDAPVMTADRWIENGGAVGFQRPQRSGLASINRL